MQLSYLAECRPRRVALPCALPAVPLLPCHTLPSVPRQRPRHAVPSVWCCMPGLRRQAEGPVAQGRRARRGRLLSSSDVRAERRRGQRVAAGRALACASCHRTQQAPRLGARPGGLSPGGPVRRGRLRCCYRAPSAPGGASGSGSQQGVPLACASCSVECSMPKRAHAAVAPDSAAHESAPPAMTRCADRSATPGFRPQMCRSFTRSTPGTCRPPRPQPAASTYRGVAR